MGQVINLGLTYGTTYSSGAMIFNGGDTAGNLQRRELIDRLLKKGLADLVSGSKRRIETSAPAMEAI